MFKAQRPLLLFCALLGVGIFLGSLHFVDVHSRSPKAELNIITPHGDNIRTELGTAFSNWHFLTGDKDYIYDLANKGFNLYAGENNKASGGFEHSGFFALIDKDGNIRCRRDDFGNPILYYDGLDKKGVRDIQQDISILLKE